MKLAWQWCALIAGLWTIGLNGDAADAQLAAASKPLDWLVTHDGSSPCVHESPPTETEMRAFLTMFANAPDNSKYDGQAEMLSNAFEKVTGHGYPVEGSKCRDAICEAEKMVGKGLGLRYLYLQVRYGLDAAPRSWSDHDQSKPRLRWTVAELDEVLAILLDYPVSFPINSSIEKSSSSGMTEAKGLPIVIYASADVINIVFHPEYFSQVPSIRRTVLIHELAHEVLQRDMMRNIRLSEEDIEDETDQQTKSRFAASLFYAWHQLGGWPFLSAHYPKRYTNPSLPKTMPSQYAATSVQEDFAESVVAYRYRPDLLKRVSPEKAKLIGEVVFHGRSFDNYVACEMPNVTDQLISNARRAMRRPTPSAVVTDARRTMDMVGLIGTDAATRAAFRKSLPVHLFTAHMRANFAEMTNLKYKSKIRTYVLIGDDAEDWMFIPDRSHAVLAATEVARLEKLMLQQEKTVK